MRLLFISSLVLLSSCATRSEFQQDLPSVKSDNLIEGTELDRRYQGPRQLNFNPNYARFFKETKVDPTHFADHQEEIIKLSYKYNVCPALVKAVITAESRFKIRAKSRKGALGLMQLMPKTARRLGVNPKDPKQNLEGGIKYLSILLQFFNNDLRLSLAGYNAGPKAVLKYSGIPPYKETRNYVKKVLKYMNILSKDSGIDCTEYVPGKLNMCWDYF